MVSSGEEELAAINQRLLKLKGEVGPADNAFKEERIALLERKVKLLKEKKQRLVLDFLLSIYEIK